MEPLSSPSLQSRLVAAHEKLPPACRYPPATESELSAFEARFGPIPSAFRWYLMACGGGVVGREWVDGIAQLSETHSKFVAESRLPGGWAMANAFLIGWDGAGNPVGIDLSTGTVLVEDHNFGGIHVVAPSFEALLAAGLLR
jgi:hypothetical protein